MPSSRLRILVCFVAIISLDHQIIDGADAEEFLAYMEEQLETGQFAIQPVANPNLTVRSCTVFVQDNSAFATFADFFLQSHSKPMMNRW